jgi:hypothetical protein
MSGDQQRTRAPNIRGPQRIELVIDLASGMSHEDAAIKHHRALQTIHDFSSRNGDEIKEQKALIHAEIAEEIRGIPIAIKRNRLAWLDQYHADVEEDYQSETDKVERRQLRKEATRVQRMAAEEVGDLRTKVELHTSKNLLTDYDVLVESDDGQLHAVEGSLARHDGQDV